MKKIILVCNGGMSTSMLAKRMKDEGGGKYEVSAYGEQEYTEHLDGAACVLVGPQIRYLIPQIKQNVSVPVESIKPQIYGRMDAKAVLEMVEKLLGE